MDGMRYAASAARRRSSVGSPPGRNGAAAAPAASAEEFLKEAFGHWPPRNVEDVLRDVPSVDPFAVRGYVSQRDVPLVLSSSRKQPPSFLHRADEKPTPPGVAGVRLAHATDRIVASRLAALSAAAKALQAPEAATPAAQLAASPSAAPPSASDDFDGKTVSARAAGQCGGTSAGDGVAVHPSGMTSAQMSTTRSDAEPGARSPRTTDATVSVADMIESLRAIGA